ncbi:MAG: DUF63 family protein [Candidatus Methanoperedens sp.]|nr:DUF63 family protein [Candidatus Methanoperedens sp.]MCE8425940.1 DUF63 family protein [Candidatus Methanoperedens sp.]MCE8427369.1 DUF63 family protein [Candidatus Methanoperedens sp.]
MNIIDTIWQFINTYYIDGIKNDTSYNIVDTVTYAIILGISIFGILKLLRKSKIVIDTRFIIAIVPYILAGSSLRVLKDSGFFAPPWKYLFVTPFIYFVIFAVAISVLALCVYLERSGKIRDYHPFFAYFGLAWTIFNLAILLMVDQIKYPVAAAAIFTLGIGITFAIYFISKRINFELLTDKLNISILFAHMLDASSTFIGMDWLGYYEKHVAPSFFIDLAGNYMEHPAIIMYVLKLSVFIPVLYMIDNKFENEREKELIAMMKLAILVLGLSPAVRNTLRILMGV